MHFDGRSLYGHRGAKAMQTSTMEMLVIDDASTDAQLALAAERLAHCRGAVSLGGIATLVPRPREIECRIAGPDAGFARCEEEYKVAVENAARALESSRLGRVLPDRPLRWVIVEDDSEGANELWRAECHSRAP
jgi:hypothetical protein